MFAKCFLMECLTNLHVGGGDVNFNIIDNEVEKDPVTGFPTINSSGMKGALRDFFVANNSGLVESVFGRQPKDGKDSEGKGKVKILNANMLAVTMRATDKKSTYYIVSNNTAIDEQFNELCKALPVETKEIIIKYDVKDRQAEGRELKGSCECFREKVYIMGESDFGSVSLPVLARNQLENGISKNLWYEEIVPHGSLFYFFALADDEKLLNDFSKVIENQVIQFGGNASIGYGLCKITEFTGGKENE